ncbi:hypothetical protein D9M73_193620 [compost metagenome]
MKPMPRPPISTRGLGRAATFLQGISARASSEPCMRVFINWPPWPPWILMTKSSPCSNRHRAPPLSGIGAVSSRTKRFMAHLVKGSSGSTGIGLWPR